MNLSDSNHNIVSGSSIELYNNLNPSTRSLIDSMKRVVCNIVPTEHIVDEVIDISNEGNETWYSYIVVTDLPQSESLSLNKKFITYCLENGLHKLLNSAVTFRFKVGKGHANKCTKPFDNFKKIIRRNFSG